MLNQPVFYSHHCLGWLQEEIIHIQQWAKNNNLKLNTSKSKEMLFRAHGVHGKSAHLPPTSMDIERVATHTMLGVVVNDRLTAPAVISCHTIVHAAYFTQPRNAHSVFIWYLLRNCHRQADILFPSLGWIVAERSRINSFLTRCKRFGFCDNNLQAIEVLFSEADDAFFSVSSITIYMFYRLFFTRNTWSTVQF